MAQGPVIIFYGEVFYYPFGIIEHDLSAMPERYTFPFQFHAVTQCLFLTFFPSSFFLWISPGLFYYNIL